MGQPAHHLYPAQFAERFNRARTPSRRRLQVSSRDGGPPRHHKLSRRSRDGDKPHGLPLRRSKA